MPSKGGVLEERFKRYMGVSDSDPHTINTFSWVRSQVPSFGPFAKNYVKSLFPFIQWAPRYNLTWLVGDLIAGITVGLVLVPQSLSYAKIALLQPQYGLYSSFIGVLTYAFFATSKDVSIGPVAVMSLETGNIITAVMAKTDKFTAPEIATCLAFICGTVVLGIGLLRIGWLVEFIPQPAVSGFMTGSALNIAAGQVPGLFGLASRLNTRAATYNVIINTLKNLPHTTLDAAFGLTSVFLLYFLKYSLAYLGRRYPRFARPAFFLSALRHAFMIVLFTIISWRINIHHKKPRISLVGTVPSGLHHVGQPLITTELLAALGPHIPVATIILLLEHISIAKSFGRVSGYKINPNQELIAIGVNNTLGSVFSAYPSTGSFSRSALKNKSGVRTPAAGIPTGIVVLIALYAVAPAFYWIPNASLSALIIHAVADLVTSLPQSYAFWRVSPLEYIIFVGAVLWSVFYTIESGIYWSLTSSVALLLFRLARPKGNFLGRIRIQPEESGLAGVRDVFVPLNGERTDQAHVEPPPPGVVIYRFEESFLYPNASYINDRLIDHVKAHTRRGQDSGAVSKGDRPWNDPGPPKGGEARLLEEEQAKPRLKAVILDCSAVANLDTTGVQNLIDTRKEVEKWADRPVEFHFTGILSPWIRRALIAGGFGIGRTRHGSAMEIAPVVPLQSGPLVDEETRDTDPRGTWTPNSEAGVKEGEGNATGYSHPLGGNEVRSPEKSVDGQSQRSTPLLDRDTPFFHFDLEDAMNSLDLS